MSSNGTLPLGEVRARAAAALAPAQDTDPAVHMDVVDAVQPPALVLFWDDPWMEPGVPNGRTMGPCVWTARLLVLLVASRVEPGPGVEQLEQLTVYTLERLQADGYVWPAATVQAPRVFTINGVPLLGARISYRVPVTLT